MLTVQYTVGADWLDYKEETIYGRIKEKLLDHKLETALSLRQPWGTASGSVQFSQYLTAPSNTACPRSARRTCVCSRAFR